jgi:hypothetical protein
MPGVITPDILEERVADAKVISNETHCLTKGTIAGECNADLQRQVATWLSQLDGQQVFVYVRQVDGRLTVEQLAVLLKVEPT